MKRILRFCFSLIFALLALAVTVVIVFMVKPEWQRDLMVAGLEQQTGMQWKASEAHLAGWGRLKAEEVFALKGSDGFQFASGDLTFDVGRFVSSRTVVVETGNIQGAFIDLSTLPPEAFGSSAREMRRGVPRRETLIEAVDTMVQLALTRMAATGLKAEFLDLSIEGMVLFPANRRLKFDALVVRGDVSRPEDVVVEVRSVEFL